MVDANPGARTEDDDRFGFSESRLTGALRKLVPQSLARRSVAVRVRTDKHRYRPGESVDIDIEFRNRFPVPVVVATPSRRLWGWTVDGRLEASDEPRYVPDSPGAFRFRARERKRVRRTWDGRVERVDDRVRETLSPGTYEIRAFVATTERRPCDVTTIEITRF
ncbi:hypothetical protein [Halorussus salinisoli]|uniref:hypothetical protein n=1 Tax=Halorussus salinisoli TaxID=2558242 RepID=UPI0010C1A331|nr:hypothetical protein [Halorussus salinisoli]